MGWIKKAILFLTGLIVILAISLYAFKYIRATKANQTKVPDNSYAIVQINLDNLFISIFKNYLFNSSEYDQPEEDKAEIKTAKIWNIGLAIPSSLYFFSLSDTPTCFYSILEIKDLNKLQSFLTQQLDFSQDSTLTGTPSHLLKYYKKHIHILLDGEKAILSFGTKPADNILMQLLKDDQGKWVSVNPLSESLQEIKNGDITYFDKNKNWTKLNFIAGAVDISGSITSTLFKFPSTSLQRDKANDDVLSLQLNTDLPLLLKSRQANFSPFKLPLDSLSRYVGNFIDIQLKDNMVIERDTIITYDYDDNFEMIEKTALQDVEVPNISIHLKGSPHLLAYLPEKIFYKFAKSQSQDLLRLTTNNEIKESMQYKPSEYALQFHYTKNPIVDPYLDWIPSSIHKIQQAELKGKAMTNNELCFYGEFQLVNPNLHSLYQLLED